MGDLSRLSAAASGGQTVFRNEYVCPGCDTQWAGDWSATCNDDCPVCGRRDVSPVASNDVTSEYLA